MNKPVTLEEIEAPDKTMLAPLDVAGYLQAHPETLRWQAREEPEKLGFPVIVAKTRVKIPKDCFVFFCRYGRPIIEIVRCNDYAT